MPTYKLTQTIDRPVADVFATVADLTTFPGWNPTTVSVTKLTESEPGEGSRFEMAIKGYGKQELELTEYDENKRVRLTPHSKMIGGGHRFTFTAEGDKTRVDHELEMRAKGIWVLMTPIMGMMSKKNLKTTAAALQAHLESERAAKPAD